MQTNALTQQQMFNTYALLSSASCCSEYINIMTMVTSKQNGVEAFSYRQRDK